MYQITTTIRCPPELLNLIDEIALERMCPRSTLVREALGRWLRAERPGVWEAVLSGE